MIHPSNIKVLMYHRVLPDIPEKPTSWHFVTEEQFQWQMQMLDRFNYTPITFADYKLGMDGELALPQKPIILTFDDGYLDTYERALPILEEFNMRAVVYIMSGTNPDVPTATNKTKLWDEDGKHEPCALMSTAQIVQIDARGHEIGSHAISHRPLSLLDDEEIWFEINESRHWLGSLLGKEVISISYPYGAIDSRVLKYSSEAGYQFGCGVYTGPAYFIKNPHDIRRLAIDQRISQMQFLLRLLTPYEYAEWAYSKVRTRKRSARTVSQRSPSADINLQDSLP